MDKLDQQIEDLDTLIKSCKNEFDDMEKQRFHRLNRIDEEAYRFSTDRNITAKLDELRILERNIRYEQDEVLNSLLHYRRKLSNEKEETEYNQRREGVSNGS